MTTTKNAAFSPSELPNKSVAESSLAGLKLSVRDGESIKGASRRATYAGWIKIYLTGPCNLLIRDDDETLAYLREHSVPVV